MVPHFVEGLKMRVPSHQTFSRLSNTTLTTFSVVGLNFVLQTLLTLYGYERVITFTSHNLVL